MPTELIDYGKEGRLEARSRPQGGRIHALHRRHDCFPMFGGKVLVALLLGFEVAAKGIDRVVGHLVERALPVRSILVVAQLHILGVHTGLQLVEDATPRWYEQFGRDILRLVGHVMPAVGAGYELLELVGIGKALVVLDELGLPVGIATYFLDVRVSLVQDSLAHLLRDALDTLGVVVLQAVESFVHYFAIVIEDLRCRGRLDGRIAKVLCLQATGLVDFGRLVTQAVHLGKPNGRNWQDRKISLHEYYGDDA